METIILCCTNSNGWLNWLNLGLAIFAALIAIGYFVKPRLFFVGFVHDNKWKVRVINRNLLLAVKEVQCEIVVSEHKNFRIEKTLPLKKDKTLILKRFKNTEDDYIFRAMQNIQEIQSEHKKNTKAIANERDYKYICISMLAMNFMGIRKYYRRIYELQALKEFKSDEAKPDPISYSQHKKCQRKMYQNLKCN